MQERISVCCFLLPPIPSSSTSLSLLLSSYVNVDSDDGPTDRRTGERTSSKEVEKLPLLHPRRPREEIDAEEIGGREDEEDAPEAPDPSPLVGSETELREVLVAVAPDADVAGGHARWI